MILCLAKDKRYSDKKTFAKDAIAYLIRHVPSGLYLSRIRVRGKLIHRSPKASKLAVAIDVAIAAGARYDNRARFKVDVDEK